MRLPPTADIRRMVAAARSVDADDRRWQAAWRGVLVAAQAATILLTWKVWQVRELPPPAPLAAVWQIDMALPLIASLAIVLARPTAGLTLHTALLGWAMIADQCRIQPQVISLACLLWGTSGLPGGSLLGRSSLTATWLYAGLHKLTSATYFDEVGTWMLDAVWPGGPPGLAAPLAATVAVAEVALGIGTLLPACRRAVAIGAVVLHATVLAVLVWRLDWNYEVWPWNAALACAGPLLVARWRGPALGDAWPAAPRMARGLAALVLVAPVGYWLGVVDAYLAHCLYAENTPRAFICNPFGRRNLRDGCYRLGVVLPPAERIFIAVFRGLGRPGEWLEIEDPRWIARWRGTASRTVQWQDIDRPRQAGADH